MFRIPRFGMKSLVIVVIANFIMYFPARVAASPAAIPLAEIRSEAQYRSEASRYDAAMRAIAGIATMKLDTPADLKRALEILRRERPNLKFHRAKLIVLSLSDSTFTNAVKRRATDKQTAEAFARELAADRKGIQRLEGASTLNNRLRSSDEADAATLRRASEKLKVAGERFRRTGHHYVSPSNSSPHKPLPSGMQDTARPGDGVFVDDHTIALVLTAVILITVFVGTALIRNIFTDEGRDAIAECLETNDQRYARCLADLGPATVFDLANLIYLAGVALCETDWLARAAACLLAP